MRCLCYAKFQSGGAIPAGEFCAHLTAKWSCNEDSPGPAIKMPNRNTMSNCLLPQSIVFIADCESLEQMTTDLATMPGTGISNLNIFPFPEVVEYQ
jgi:hypothetical protein